VDFHWCDPYNARASTWSVCTVPYRTRCVHCETIGLVRAEHVIIGRRAMTEFFCGKCNHAWTIAHDGRERRAKPRPVKKTGAGKPEPV